MASVPIKSGSSGGGGNQPPKKRNKRSKMETENPSNPELDKKDSIHSDPPGPVSSVISVEPDYLQCPICKDYPRMEVYQCDDGHIVCHECYSKIIRCPVCRALYTEKKIRSRVAETDLDRMSFNCSFRDSGCLKTNIPRNRRSAHEIQCDFNPNPTGFKCVYLFDGSRACQFRFDPDSINRDPGHTKDVIEHLTSLPHNLLFKKIKIQEEGELRFLLLNSFAPPFEPFVLFELINGTTRKTIGYYVVFLRVSISVHRNLSCAVVGLNSAPVDFNGGNRHSDKITVTFSIKAKINTNKVARDGAGCVPNLSWPTKSRPVNEWKEFMMSPIADRPPFSFSVPIIFLSEHYEQEDGRYKMSVSFGPLVD